MKIQVLFFLLLVTLHRSKKLSWIKVVLDY